MTVKEIFQTMDYGPAPESDDNANAWLDRHGRRFGHFIDGAFVEPSEGQWFETVDPSSGELIAHVGQGSERDVALAVEAARKAQRSWEKLTGHARARYLYGLARHIQKHGRLFAVLESMDNGKSIRETRDLDIPLVARHFYHHAGWAQLRDDEVPGYVPAGVAGQIIPWNFPLLMLAWKVAPALAAGCSVVLKPAEFTPLTAMLFAEMTREVGLPPGVLNIVNGDGQTGAMIVRHPDVDKLAFTGSTEVGRIIREASAGSGKKLSLELGGKSPFIVFEDADIDSAVEGVVDAIWFNQGQVCCAGSRLLVQEGVYPKMIDKLRARMETLRVGDPLDKGIDIGAIVAPVQLQKIQSFVEQGKAEGATCYQPSWAVPEEGSFYPPTLFADVEPASMLAQVEIFGPVMAAMSFRTPDEAVELANNTRYGLAASVWTENLNLALDVAPKLAAGVVWINSTNLFDAAAGFGGYRESGFGREGGAEGMYEYLAPAWTKGLSPYGEGDLVRVRSGDVAGGAFGEWGADEDDDPVDPGDGAALLGGTSGLGGVASYGDASGSGDGGFGVPAVDRTAKLYIGGKQKRPDGNYSFPILGADGRHLGEAGLGNRKDVRDAVEAAHKAGGWTRATAHNRAQVLYFLAENLAARREEFAARIDTSTGVGGEDARAEVDASVERIFEYAALADKYDGRVHHTPIRNVTLAMPEPWGVMGIACPDEAPLLAFVSLVMPAVALGNRVVVVPSPRAPLVATDLYQVLDTSDVPGGVINIVTGDRDELADVLSKHDDVACMWYVGSAEGSAAVERNSVGNLKATWVNDGYARDWHDPVQASGREYLRRATRIKNIWVPYGE